MDDDVAERSNGTGMAPIVVGGMVVLAVVAIVTAVVFEGMGSGNVRDTYVARIGPQDHVTSAGVRHDTVAGVLRQDRANVHRFDAADEEDEVDTVFDDPAVRATMERLVSRGLFRPETSAAIINGNPLIEVTVRETRIDVEILEN